MPGITRQTLRQIARERIAEAEHLLRAGHSGGAYYLTGFALECALKACVAKKTRRHDFPDKRLALDAYTHDLPNLVRAAGLERALAAEITRNGRFERNWTIVREWDDDLRYTRVTRRVARELFRAASSTNDGVIPWVRRYW